MLCRGSFGLQCGQLRRFRGRRHATATPLFSQTFLHPTPVDGRPQTSSPLSAAAASSSSSSRSATSRAEMRREKALQTSLLSLAVLMAVVGICTFSLKKMLGTYAFGIVGIGGILLPDWEFFDRDFSEWFKPMPVRRNHADSGNWRFNLYPLRVTMLTLIYSFGLYKWWMFISS